jgi:RNA polymerase sigma factor (sigma-70 family)
MHDARLAPGFTDLYRAQYGRVRRFVARRVTNGAEDLTAEVFRIAWDRARAGTEVSPAWLFGTARNVVLNHQRAMQRGERLRQAAATQLRVELGTHPAGDAVRDTLAALPEGHREVLMLRYWDEFGAAEIAALLQISVSAAWVRLHRARRAFHDAFQVRPGVHDAQS